MRSRACYRRIADRGASSSRSPGARPGCGRWHFAERRTPDAARRRARRRGCTRHVRCRSAPFGVPVPIAELNNPASNDGTLRLLARRAVRLLLELSRRSRQRASTSRRARPRERRSSITPVQGLELDGQRARSDAIAADGTLLVFRHNMPGDDLYEATRDRARYVRRRHRDREPRHGGDRGPAVPAARSATSCVLVDRAPAAATSTARRARARRSRAPSAGHRARDRRSTRAIRCSRPTA